MGACVLLLHELSDGDSHYDWLIDPSGSESAAAGLLAFRLTARIDLELPPRFEAQRIADHRRLYLTYEGPLTGGRGSVRRLAAGRMVVEELSPRELVLTGHLGNARGRLSGAISVGDQWIFSTEPEAGLASAGVFC